MALAASDTYLDEAIEVQRLGYSAIWLPGGQIDRLNRLADLAGATPTIPIGSAVISLDVYSADQVRQLWTRLEAAAPGRLLVGLGGPQQPRPLRALNDYLDDLDHGEPAVPATRRILAALGPRKLDLARDRCAGAILLLVTPAYVGTAREILGDRATLVIDQMLVYDADPARARQTARRPLRFMSGLPGYRASFARMGFSDADIDSLDDRLVDELVIWGDADRIAARVGRLWQAGADHVVLHAIAESGQPGPIEVARALAQTIERPGFRTGR